MKGSFAVTASVGHSGNIKSEAELIDENAVFLIASCTKLITSIAAVQLVERNLIGLDDDVSPILPDLAAQRVLKGFTSERKPILEERKKPITLRYVRLMSTRSVCVERERLIVLPEAY